MAASEGFAALQAHVREVMDTHHPQVARWDRDMTAEGDAAAGAGGPEGVLPTLRATEDTLLRVEDKCARVSKLLQLQERYRQDSSGLQERVRALYEAVADEDASQTDLRRQQMHERSQAVFAAVKSLRERVRKAQAAYKAAGVSLSLGAGGASGGAASEEGLGELRAQLRRLSERLHRVRHHVQVGQEGQHQNRRQQQQDEGAGAGNGGEEDGPPPLSSSM